MGRFFDCGQTLRSFMGKLTHLFPMKMMSHLYTVSFLEKPLRDPLFFIWIIRCNGNWCSLNK